MVNRSIKRRLSSRDWIRPPRHRKSRIDFESAYILSGGSSDERTEAVLRERAYLAQRRAAEDEDD